MTHSPAHLILTVDYELFGNGEGGIAECVTAPTERILALAERFEAPVTLFVESLEFAAMAVLPDGDGQMSSGVAAVRRQVADAVSRGHDAQLHVHPQWLDARWQPGGGWRLDNSRWRIGDLGADEAVLAIKSGKDALEEMLAAVPDYRCVAFRAGAWCLQPARHVVSALHSAGMVIDSSVAPGMYNPSRGDWYDFRSAPRDRTCWPVEDDVCRPADVGLWELPIATGPVSWPRHLWKKGMDILRRRESLAPGCEGSYAGPNSPWQSLRGKFGKVCASGRSMLDLSTLDSGQMIAVVESWLHRPPTGDLPTPVVAISHSKNFTDRSAAETERFLAWAAGQEKIRFSTYRGWLEAVEQGDR